MKQVRRTTGECCPADFFVAAVLWLFHCGWMKRRHRLLDEKGEPPAIGRLPEVPLHGRRK